MSMYERICEKLGFDFMKYNPEIRDTEYDGEDNPFEKLTLEELDFVMEYSKKHYKKK